jgi:hypothetical protein
MRQFSFACMLGYACVMAAPAYAWTPSEISIVAGLQNFVIDSGVDFGEVKILTDKTTHAIQFVNGKPHLVPADAPPSPVAPLNMLPHASVTQGERNIAAAWLATATDRYNHGVLGDEIGAATVAARLQNGDVLRYDLPADSVFKNLTPCL